MMNTRGMEGPFQLFIAVIVMGMSLVIGFYLISMVSCWRCNETAKIVTSNFKETIANVGKGDIGTADVVSLNLPDCISGIYLKHIDANCRVSCPMHPMSCWIILLDSRCSGRIMQECIDISGDTVIDAQDLNINPIAYSSSDQSLQNALPFTMKTYNIRVSKEAGNTIKLGKP